MQQWTYEEWGQFEHMLEYLCATGHVQARFISPNLTVTVALTQVHNSGSMIEFTNEAFDSVIVGRAVGLVREEGGA